MPAINASEYEASYALAKRVQAGSLTEAQASQMLVTEHGMDRGSANGYIRQLGKFLSGELYKRTINDGATRYYLSRIKLDYGDNALGRALEALKAHIEYYEKVSSAKRPSLRLILSEHEKQLVTFDKMSRQFDYAVSQSLNLSAAELEKLLPPKENKPTSVTVTTKIFIRSPHVVAAALIRAAGICERCKRPAPFVKKSDGLPFLEVHHIHTLANLGSDTLDNVLALCPNCHRELHHG